MLPTLLTHELMEGVQAFLRSTYPTSTPAFKSSFDSILEGVGRDKLFQGPYLRVGLPFEQDLSVGQTFFKQLKTRFPPFKHQEKAWGRLQRDTAQSTLIATGTGSGKTECFMYPILDHILANPSSTGIKAIILYPMNALASDQARRFAKEVHSNPACQGKVRVGLYVGGKSDDSVQMTETGVITDRKTLRNTPPDILMTNYKMLDYLLIRSDDRELWSKNLPDTLKYLVVDELHTFDGAQGSDLACLIRRLKARLKTPNDHLCAIGTSATLGGEDAAEGMLTFARLIFGEPFSRSAIIKESRIKLSVHIEPENAASLEILYFTPPPPEYSSILSPSGYSNILSYLEAQIPLWFDGERLSSPLNSPDGRVELSNKLRQHNFLRTFLSFFKKLGVIEEKEMLSTLGQRFPKWSQDHLLLLLHSFISLCAFARNEPRKNAYFLQLRSEFWMRELGRMVASVSPDPEVRFSHEIGPDHAQQHLAPIHCRDCGVMGWGALQKTSQDELIPELDRFYSAFFSINPDPRLRFIFPKDTTSPSLDHANLLDSYLCGACLSFFDSKDGRCPDCGTETYSEEHDNADVCTFQIESWQRIKQKENVSIADKSCPYCESATGLTIVGSRAASLTSVALSQLFGSPFNDDKKAMAFSDSVQDASHRAGFFSARTYPIAMRTALHEVISKTTSPLTLQELSIQYPQYWQAKNGPNDFVGTFIPPRVEWLSEFENFKCEGLLSAESALPNIVSDCLSWDVIKEFGIQSRIGRTLEKSSAASVSLNPNTIRSAATDFLKDLHELSQTYHSIQFEDAVRLLIALSERLRLNGGVYHPFLDQYIEQNGNAYLFNRRNSFTLPPIPQPGRGKRPVFFSTHSKKDTYESLVGKGTSFTWCQLWVAKWLRSLIGDVADASHSTPILEFASAALTSAEVWKKFPTQQQDQSFAWGLSPDHIEIHTDAAQMACHGCGHQLTTNSVTQSYWENMPCLRHKCLGHYELSTIKGGSFFGNLYKKGNIARLRASEHTGMLDRQAREQIETEFMRDPSRPTDTTMLSCTPTLEMGVDIGDLSSVILCSVPPEQANYIQRVGRGGRKDGNSLALTIATSDAHDLSYYEEPLNMLAGDVHMPAIFLNAPAVLERQITAYCTDRWIEVRTSANIPQKMSAIYIQIGHSTNDDYLGTFPQALYRYIEENLTHLIDGFLAMFKDQELSQTSRDYLSKFLKGDNEDDGSLSFKMNRCFEASFTDRKQLMARRTKLTQAITKNRAQKARDEKLESDLDTLLMERKGLSRLIRELNDKQTLNFLTDEGLLPNYAFPEEGVTLRSIILKKTENKQENAKLVKLEFEHVRPAEAAISELAPGNSFYVEGRKLTVDRVSIDQDDYQEWHFCRSCSHMEPVSELSEAIHQCPKCHCTAWNDLTLKQKMLKMRQVFVTAWDKDTRSLDQKDKRDLTSFNKQLSISHQKESIKKSYLLKSEGAVFAFDFIDEITLREVNMGSDQYGQDSIQIGGKQLLGIGFKVCTGCGKIQTPQIKEDKRHDIACPYRDQNHQEKFEDSFLLYRELHSEAIRLLIPSLNEDENVDTQSFVAAINLGLKSLFGGQLSHLKLSVQQQPIEGSTLKAQHVYIYDSVPGGTGYLKDLMRNADSLFNVLQKAYNSLNQCSCQHDPTLDGCYQCIKAYRFRFVHNHISRDTAMRQLKMILDHQEAVEEQSADDAMINPLLESELERRFIESLRQIEGFKLTPEIVDGKTGYLLHVKTSHDHPSTWKVVPQVELGEQQGVSVMSRPDFVLAPLRNNQGKPIAVFLDGFAYHANDSNDNNRIADDIVKRNAIRESDNYLVWSLTWNDLHSKKETSHTSTQLLTTALKQLPPFLRDQSPELASLWKDTHWNSWQLLTIFLKDRAINQDSNLLTPWINASSLLSCCFPSRLQTNMESLEPSIESMFLGNAIQIPDSSSPTHIVSYHDQSLFKLISAVPIEDLRNRKFTSTLSALWFDDHGEIPEQEFKTEWQEFLRACNIFQFIPRFTCCSYLMIKEGILSNSLEWLLHSESSLTTTPPLPLQSHLTEDQKEELELLDENLQSIIPFLINGELPWPEFGYEGTSETTTCNTSIIEVAWPQQKLGVALPDDHPDAFLNNGWTILSANPLDTEKLLATFKS